MSDEEWQNSVHRGDHWMSQQPDGAAAVQVSDEVARKLPDVVDAGRETGSGGVSTDVAKETSMASPRPIPAPDSPPLSVRLPPEPAVEETGEASASSDCKCAPSQAPVSDIANYDQLPLGQLH